MLSLLTRGGAKLRRQPKRLLNILTARSLVVISTTCVILYGIFWGVGALQASTLSPAFDAVITQPVLSSPEMPGSGATASGLTLEIAASPSVQPWVLDAQGGGVGVNPDTGLVRLQTQGASYSGKGSSPQTIDIPNANGNYQVRLSVPGDGQFELRVRLYPGTDRPKAREYAGGGQALANSTWTCNVSVVAGTNGGAAELNVSDVRSQPTNTYQQ